MNDHGIWHAFVHFSRNRPVLFAGYLVLGGFLAVLLCGAAIGVFRVWRKRTTAVMVTLGAVAYFLVMSGGPVATSRFRHPVMPMICVFMGVGLGSWRPLSAHTPPEIAH